MALTFHDDVAVLADVVAAEDAERLLEWLLGQGSAVDLSRCTHLHAAVLQLLLSAPIRVIAWPTDPDLRQWLEAALSSANGQ
jgi:hypothetical protein